MLHFQGSIFYIFQSLSMNLRFVITILLEKFHFMVMHINKHALSLKVHIFKCFPELLSWSIIIRRFLIFSNMHNCSLVTILITLLINILPRFYITVKIIHRWCFHQAVVHRHHPHHQCLKLIIKINWNKSCLGFHHPRLLKWVTFLPLLLQILLLLLLLMSRRGIQVAITKRSSLINY